MNDALIEHIDSAYEALYEGRIDEAKAALDRARRNNPKAAEVRLLEIDVLDADGLSEEAVTAAEEALEALPRSMLLKLKYATLLLDTYDDVPSARPLLEDLWQRLQKGEKPDVSQPAAAEAEEGAGDDAVADFTLEVLLTLSDTRAADHDPAGALEAARATVELAPDDAMAHVALGAAQFDMCQIDDAQKTVARAIDKDPRCADAYWLRGRIFTFTGDHAGADKAFAKAKTLDEERFMDPFRLDEDAFAKMMTESLNQLPPQVQAYLKNVAVAVEDVPELARVRDNQPPLSPGSLGLFEGTPPSLAQGDDPWAHFPKRITLFRKNIEISCSNADELKDLVSSTLLHEVGHYLGLDEDDLDERGLG